MDTNDRIAYFAGFIDGEGCIRIAKGHTHASGKRIFYLGLSVQQVDRRPLDALVERYGGSLRHVDDTKRKTGIWSWTVSGRTAARVIREVLPYLITKREQAILGLEFQDRKGDRGRGQSLPTSAEELAKQEEMFEQMRLLKHIPAEAYLDPSEPV